jgi:hypothetical protein
MAPRARTLSASRHFAADSSRLSSMPKFSFLIPVKIKHSPVEFEEPPTAADVPG